MSKEINYLIKNYECYGLSKPSNLYLSGYVNDEINTFVKFFENKNLTWKFAGEQEFFIYFDLESIKKNSALAYKNLTSFKERLDKGIVEFINKKIPNEAEKQSYLGQIHQFSFQDTLIAQIYKNCDDFVEFRFGTKYGSGFYDNDNVMELRIKPCNPNEFIKNYYKLFNEVYKVYDDVVYALYENVNQDSFKSISGCHNIKLFGFHTNASIWESREGKSFNLLSELKDISNSRDLVRNIFAGILLNSKTNLINSISKYGFFETSIGESRGNEYRLAGVGKFARFEKRGGDEGLRLIEHELYELIHGGYIGLTKPDLKMPALKVLGEFSADPSHYPAFYALRTLNSAQVKDNPIRLFSDYPSTNYSELYLNLFDIDTTKFRGKKTSVGDILEFGRQISNLLTDVNIFGGSLKVQISDDKIKEFEDFCLSKFNKKPNFEQFFEAYENVKFHGSHLNFIFQEKIKFSYKDIPDYFVNFIEMMQNKGEMGIAKANHFINNDFSSFVVDSFNRFSSGGVNTVFEKSDEIKWGSMLDILPENKVHLIKNIIKKTQAEIFFKSINSEEISKKIDIGSDEVESNLHSNLNYLTSLSKFIDRNNLRSKLEIK